MTKKIYTAVASLSLIWFGWFIPTVFFVDDYNWNLHYRGMVAGFVSIGALAGLAFSSLYFTEEEKNQQRLELPKMTIRK